MVSRHVPQLYITFSRNLFLIYYYFDKISCKKIRILYQSFRQNTRVCNIVYNLLEKKPACIASIKINEYTAEGNLLYCSSASARVRAWTNDLWIQRYWQWEATVLPTWPSRHLYIYIYKILIVLQNGY